MLVLEGRQRIGGRLYTLDDVPGRPEGGGSLVAAAYGRVIAAGQPAARWIAVDFTQLAATSARRLRGRPPNRSCSSTAPTCPLEEWPRHPLNPFADAQKALPPWAWAEAQLGRRLPFKDLARWPDPEFSKFDIPVYDYLRSQGASDAAIQLAFDTNISYGTTSHDVSLLMQVGVAQWRNASSRCSAGQPDCRSSAGIRGWATSDCRKRWRAISRAICSRATRGRDYAAGRWREVRCEDGTRHRAKAVVSSMPFATLRHVRIDPLPPAVQNAAIRTLGYVPVTQVHVVPTAKFWEQDGLSPSMWTDGITGTVMAQRSSSDPAEIMSIAAWARGLNARYLDRLGVEGAGAAIVAELERLRPAAKGKLKVAKVRSWGMDPFAGGVWSTFGPGQVTAFVADMAKPHGRLFFCGEHTALASRGMEAALESAERATVEVQLALG